jgi:hypothetical protein
MRVMPSTASRLRVARTVEGSGANLKRLVPQRRLRRLGIGLSCVVRVRLPRAIQPGLYVLLLIHADRTLADFQMNAVSVTRGDAAPRPSSSRVTCSGATRPSIAGAALSFVSLMNAADRAGQAPQFIVMTGDIVDGQFGSAGKCLVKALRQRGELYPRLRPGMAGPRCAAGADLSGARQPRWVQVRRCRR